MEDENTSLHSDGSSHLPEPSVSTLEGPSDHVNGTSSKLADDEPPPFPFFMLPLELRQYVYSHILVQDNQPLQLTRRPKSDKQPKNDATAILATSRRVYVEARPIFLSGNAFSISGTLADYKWLTGLGPEGREQLRKVTLSNVSQSYSESNYRTFNKLSGCPKLSLTIKMYGRHLVNLDHLGVFKYMHGFSRATISEDLSGVDRDCYVYQHGMIGYECKVEDEYLRLLLGRLESACPTNCRVHKARGSRVSAATVHIDCRYGCPLCYRGRF